MPGRAPTPICTCGSGSGCTPLIGDVLAWTYVLDAFEGGLPSARTIGLMADAAQAAAAPDDYVAARARECRSVGD